jgi:ribosomal protein S18 acetylase RimI-like enzyme
VERVGPARLEAAARRLVAAPGRDEASAGRRFLDVARAHGLDLTHFWASIEPGGEAVREVCLASVGPGRTAMIFTSTPPDPPGRAELSGVVDAACAGLQDAHLAQSLLSGEDEPLEGVFLDAGFARLSRLHYLRRHARPGDRDLAGAIDDIDARLVPWRDAGDDELADALTRSYEGTRDCPELCDLRDISDVIASHRGAGHWDPDLWWIVRASGRAAGAMLLNPSPELGAVELVYLGVAPELRGRGVASALLRHAFASLSGRIERSLTCAVDERNTPARELYRRAGFVEFDSRLALIRPLRTRGG